MIDEFFDGLDFDSGNSRWRFGYFEDLQSGFEVVWIDEVGGVEGFEWFGACFHYVGEGGISWGIESKVGAEDGGEFELEFFYSGIHLAGDIEGVAVDFYIGDEASLAPVEEAGEDLAGISVVVIDGLFSEDDEFGVFALNEDAQ